MQSVDAVTGGMGTAEVPVPALATEPPIGASVQADPSPAIPPTPADPWAPLLDAGLRLLQTLAEGADQTSGGSTAMTSHLHTDPATGQR